VQVESAAGVRPSEVMVQLKIQPKAAPASENTGAAAGAPSAN